MSIVALVLLLAAGVQAGNKKGASDAPTGSLVGRTVILRGPDVAFGDLGADDTLVVRGRLKWIAQQVLEEKGRWLRVSEDGRKGWIATACGLPQRRRTDGGILGAPPGGGNGTTSLPPLSLSAKDVARP